jgi:hypothetical protein
MAKRFAASAVHCSGDCSGGVQNTAVPKRRTDQEVVFGNKFRLLQFDGAACRSACAQEEVKNMPRIQHANTLGFLAICPDRFGDGDLSKLIKDEKKSHTAGPVVTVRNLDILLQVCVLHLSSRRSPKFVDL